jgi:hypothetical protein
LCFGFNKNFINFLMKNIHINLAFVENSLIAFKNFGRKVF